MPDWSANTGVGLGITGYERFDAAQGMQQTVIIYPDEGDLCRTRLELQATYLDSITISGETKRDVLNGTSCGKWLDILRALGPIYRHDKIEESTFDVLWRCLITNTSDRGSSGDGEKLGAGQPPLASMGTCFSH